MIDRNIFTESKPSRLERILDVALAVFIGLSLTLAVLHGLDSLFA